MYFRAIEPYFRRHSTKRLTRKEILTADDQKKNGFYVDFKDGKFYSPTRIESEMYTDSIQIVGKYIKSLSMVENFKPDDYKIIENKNHLS